MISPNVIQILDLVDPNDPIFACESFLQRTELGSLRRQARSSNPVLSLSRREQRVVVVVRHLIPSQWVSETPAWHGTVDLHETVSHGRGSIVVHLVFAPCGEKITLPDLVWPDALRDTDHP